MPCDQCASKPYFETLCMPCFLEQLERRIRREVRTNGLLRKGDTLIITDALCERVIKDIAKDMPMTITKDERAAGKRVLPWTMDDEIDYFLNRLFAGDAYDGLGHGDGIKLFLSVREKELEAYAKAKGLPYAPKAKGRMHELIDRIEARHPETKFALAKSMKDLRKLRGLETGNP